jgi:hypothetical protein
VDDRIAVRLAPMAYVIVKKIIPLFVRNPSS